MISNPFKGYKIQIHKHAQKMLANLDYPIQDKVFKKLKELVSEHHNLDIKKITGYDNLYRIRLGDYRIVYEPLHDVIMVHVIFVGHRKDIYRELNH